MKMAVGVVDCAARRRSTTSTATAPGHSEAIVTSSEQAADAFTDGVDAAAVYVNASTRFTDGFEYGMGAEIGNSTQKLHARGPIGLRELTTYKYVGHGTGQVRGVARASGSGDSASSARPSTRRTLGTSRCAQEAIWQLGLDRVLLVPTGEAPAQADPRRPGGGAAAGDDAAGRRRGRPLRRSPTPEIEREGPSYTC